MTPFELTTASITPLPTNIYGLKFFPTLEPHCSNDQDLPNWGWPIDAIEISDCNLAIVTNIVNKLGANCCNIMEIGVHRNNERSMTTVLMNTKPTNCRYLGVDINDKSILNNPQLHINTIKANSHNKVAVRQYLKQLGMNKLDLIMIDGWHSVNTCVNDWGYVDLLSDHGVVILHDTNSHPGCIALYNAVDETLFDKHRYCTDTNDMGISVFWHKPVA